MLFVLIQFYLSSYGTIYFLSCEKKLERMKTGIKAADHWHRSNGQKREVWFPETHQL